MDKLLLSIIGITKGYYTICRCYLYYNRFH